MENEKEKLKKRMVQPMPRSPFAVPPAFAPTDPYGSYTGVPESDMEEPVQDADDL